MEGAKISSLDLSNPKEMDFNWPPEGKMMFCVQDATGDTKHIWDPNIPAEVEAARSLFNTLVTEKKYLAYRVKPDDHGKGEAMTTFDPRAGKVIISPPLVGG